MRLATIVADGGPRVVVVRDGHALPIDGDALGLRTIRDVAAAGEAGLGRVREWADRQAAGAWRPLATVTLGPAVPDPGAIYTIGHNYRAPIEPDGAGPERPLVYGKAASSVAGHGATLTWDRTVTGTVDAECELAVVIGRPAWNVAPAEALDHVFGYTIIDDVSSRDPWLDGDQWLLGKSLPGFCPVGPWIVTRDALDPTDLRLGCTINGLAIQDGRTSGMRFGIPALIAWLSRHLVLRPGDLIATGTPPRLAGPPGPGRHLERDDVVTTWIEGIGELTTRIA